LLLLKQINHCLPKYLKSSSFPTSSNSD